MSGSELVKMVVDQELCIGVGQCEAAESAVFRLDDSSGLSEVVGDGRLPLDRARAVAEACPSGAISVSHDQ